MSSSTLAHSVPEACSITQTGRTSLYEAIRSHGPARAENVGNGTSATRSAQTEGSGMSVNTALNCVHAHQSTGIEAEVRVDTPTMERLRRTKREHLQGPFLKGPVPLERIARQ